MKKFLSRALLIIFNYAVILTMPIWGGSMLLIVLIIDLFKGNQVAIDLFTGKQSQEWPL